MGLPGRLLLAFSKTLAAQQKRSPTSRAAHLPHCTHLCRPETRDGLSTSRLGRSGTAGCRAALGSGESLKLSFEGKRVPARRASGPELGSRGSELWQLRSHADRGGSAAKRQRPRGRGPPAAESASGGEQAATETRAHAVAAAAEAFTVSPRRYKSPQTARFFLRRRCRRQNVGGQSKVIRQGRRHGL